MAACHSGTGYIYISTNGGTTWTQQTQSGLGPNGNGSANWISVACTYNATQITAASSSGSNNAGSIYTYLFSTNRWTQQTTVPTNATWNLISSNTAAVITAAISNGTLYRFTPTNT
jgi:hypothetical protein